MSRPKRDFRAILPVTSLALLVGFVGCAGDTMTAAEHSNHATGFVSLTQLGGSYYAVASFQRDSGGNGLFMKTDGLCALYEVLSPDAGPSTFTPNVYAGTVTISANQTISLSYQDDGSYLAVWSEGTAFDAGQSIGVDVPGNGIDPPPFATTLTGPGPVELSAPSGTPMVVDRGQGITLGWTPTAGEYVEVGIGSSMYSSYLDCWLPMAAGQGVLPASLLDELPRGTSSLYVGSMSQVVQVRGLWSFVAAVFLEGIELEVTLS